MRRPPGSRLLVLFARAREASAVMLVGLLTLAGLLGPTAAEAAPLRISMVGDSVMLGARDQLLGHFPDATVTVDAVENRSLLGAVTVLQAAQPLGDLVVLDLGYNDTDDPGVFRQRIDAAMAVLAAVPKVIWLTQREFKPGRAGMNAELVSAAARYGNLEVVDWNAQVAAHPEDVYGDGIHLTPAGQDAMASLIRGRFDAFVAARTPATTLPTPAATTVPTSAVTTAPRAHAPTGIAATPRSALDGTSSSADAGWLVALGTAAVVVATALLVFFGFRFTRRSSRRPAPVETGDDPGTLHR